MSDPHAVTPTPHASVEEMRTAADAIDGRELFAYDERDVATRVTHLNVAAMLRDGAAALERWEQLKAGVAEIHAGHCEIVKLTAQLEDARDARDTAESELKRLKANDGCSFCEDTEARAEAAEREVKWLTKERDERLTCATCGKPASCIGRYEGNVEFAPACDTCCGHGNEDGECFQLVNEAGEYMTLADLLGQLNKSEKQSAKSDDELSTLQANVGALREQWTKRRAVMRDGKVAASMAYRPHNGPSNHKAATYIDGLIDAHSDVLKDLDTLFPVPTAGKETP